MSAYMKGLQGRVTLIHSWYPGMLLDRDKVNWVTLYIITMSTHIRF